MTDKTYNGYANWNNWNVALWLNNDEGFYETLCHYAELAAYMTISHSEALVNLLAALPDETPDGAGFSVLSVKPLLDEQIAEHIKYS